MSWPESKNPHDRTPMAASTAGISSRPALSGHQHRPQNPVAVEPGPVDLDHLGRDLLGVVQTLGPETRVGRRRAPVEVIERTHRRIEIDRRHQRLADGHVPSAEIVAEHDLDRAAARDAG